MHINIEYICSMKKVSLVKMCQRAMFENLVDLREHALSWMWLYNNERPHSALGYLIPVEFFLKCGKLPGAPFPIFQQNININFFDDFNNKNEKKRYF